jgi:hypothetical protein
MGEIIALVGTLVKNTVSGWLKIQTAKQYREIAATNNEARLLSDKESNNAAWQMAALRHSDRWLRRISFAIFSAPFICALFTPVGVQDYFRVALTAIPDWYTKTYMGIVGSIWGVAELKNAIPTIVNQIKTWKNPDLSR